MLPAGVKIPRMLFCGLDTHRADVPVWIAGFRFRADKNAKCIQFIALFGQNWHFLNLGSDVRFNHWQNCHI
jgi:hypothetical protein